MTTTAPISDRFQRYATANLNRAIVRRACSDEDWRIVAQLRKDGFTRVRGVSADGPWLDDLDLSGAAFSLIGYDLNGTPLATMRVQDSRRGPLELTRFVDVDRVLTPAETPAVQYGRLSVLRSPESLNVMFAVFKAAWQWSLHEGLQTIIIASPSWSKAIYDFLHFHSAGDAGSFTHQFAGGARHETMMLTVQALEPLWRSRQMPLSTQFFDVQHPMIQA